MEIDDRETVGYNREQLEEIMRGFPGTVMKLTVDRPGEGHEETRPGARRRRYP